MKKYVIIHGHFYQPPRENPWIDTIETQESAAPYHDWNERVHDECYRPNAYSRLLDANGAIIDIHNNYRTMNFNFGPTLFSWLEQRHIGTVRRIVEADRSSAEALEGHGNAIAQVYNHVIMPLASRRDQLTQIRWARHYFRERFEREPRRDVARGDRDQHGDRDLSYRGKYPVCDTVARAGGGVPAA